MSTDANEEYNNDLAKEVLRLEAEKQALKEEFAASLTNGDFSPEDLKDKFKGLLPAAYDQLMNLLEYAESESVRLSAAKFIFGVGLGNVKISDVNETKSDKLLRELMGGNE